MITKLAPFFKPLSLMLVAVSTVVFAPAHAADPMIKMETSAGDIVIRLYADKSPKTVANFLDYVEKKHYDGTVFHRVIKGFMIQGGGFDADLKKRPAEQTVVSESKNRLHNTRGTIAMARLADPDSASAQFFINHRDNERLDWTPFEPGYTVFGKVVTGMRVVDFIASSPTSNALATTSLGQVPLSNVPVEAIVINRVSVVSP